MSNQPPAGMAVCPICRSKGIKMGGTIAGLSTHLEEHTVKDVIAALARETVNAQHGPEVKPPAHCIAHGEPGCDLCSLNPADCAEPSGSCDEYRVDGMHFDECPNRITTYEDAVKRLHRVDGGPQFGIVYKFGREGDPCPECKGFNGKHNSVFDEHDWGTDCRRCSYDPARAVPD